MGTKIILKSWSYIKPSYVLKEDSNLLTILNLKNGKRNVTFVIDEGFSRNREF